MPPIEAIGRASRVLGLDPGSTESALVVIEGDVIIEKMKLPNPRIRQEVKRLRKQDAVSILVVEQCRVFGGSGTYQAVVDTAAEYGRIIEAWGGDWEYITRAQVKKHLIPKQKGNADSLIRAAMIERFGGEKALKSKLRGFAYDMWSALAIAVTYQDQMQEIARA